MSLSNTTRSYGIVTKSFHWLTALLIVTVIPIGVIAHDLALQIRSPGFDGGLEVIERTVLLFSLHKTIGVTIFFVAIARIIWALLTPKPGLLNAENKPEALAAETVHWLLYGSLVLVPLTGWIHHSATTGFAPIWWPFGQDLPFVAKSESVATLFAALHKIFERVMIFSVLLHVVGALKHHFIDKDLTLLRMWPGRTQAPEPPEQHHSITPLAIAVVVWIAALGIGASLGVFGSHDAKLAQSETTVATSDTSLTAPEAEPATQDTSWVVESGTLGLEITQLGSKVAGEFGIWTADIQFTDPQTNGPAGSVAVDIEIGSLSLGSVTVQAMGADFFDGAQYPAAQFQADIARIDDGYVATGTLKIRD
ncbi:MAG: cytochrome b/b6 domain-containing protein, partial [Paracoccaceae bacterium]